MVVVWLYNKMYKEFQGLKMKLTVIIPVYNECKTVADVVDNVFSAGIEETEVIVVDDCSSDGTTELLKKLPERKGLHVLYHKRNKGKGGAIRTAQQEVTGDVVVIQDADMEYNPAELPKLLEKIQLDKADVVYGSRYSGTEILIDSFWHYYGNKALTFISNFFSNLHLTDMETCYKMIRVDIFKSLNLTCNRFGIEPEITAKLARLNLCIYEVPISYEPRRSKEGKEIGWKDGIAAFWFIIKFNLFSK